MNNTNTTHPAVNPAVHVVYNAHQSALMKRVDALMWNVLRFNHELGHEFAAMRWNGHGLSFQGACCWDLMQILSELPGSWDLYVEARDLAALLQRAGAEVFCFHTKRDARCIGQP